MRCKANLAAVARALAFVVLALALCGVIFEFAGYSAIEMFESIADGAFLNPNAWQGSLRWAMPLFITACGVVVSFRSGYFNVGAQGQFYIGAIGATFVVDFLNGYPAALVVPLAFVAGNRRRRALGAVAGLSSCALGRRRSDHDADGQFHRRRSFSFM